jgi:hypothetical protein
MKGDGKLRLVRGADHEAPEPAWDAEPTLEELAAAARLRETVEGGDLAHGGLVSALRAAHAPGDLALADLDAIVGRALGHEAASTAVERAAAERLRSELDGAPAASEAGVLAEAVRAAARPASLDQAHNTRLIEAALRRPLRRRLAAVRRLAPATAATVAAFAALAAGVALFVGRSPTTPSGGAVVAPIAALVHTRSADDLFDAATPFPRTGEESARMDRIVSSRAADLRRNRFAAWGVK